MKDDGYKVPIEASHILMFARAIGDPNPMYDGGGDVNSCDVIAPPTFSSASAQFNPNYFLRPKIGEPWFGSGKNPSGIQAGQPAAGGGAGGGGGRGTSGGVGRGLHAEQHFEYHKPVKAGDILTPVSKPGKQWEKEGRRGGSLKFSESVTEYYNQDGELMITARMVGVQTEKAPEQGKD